MGLFEFFGGFRRESGNVTHDCGVCLLVYDRLHLLCAFCDWRGAEDNWLWPALARVPFLNVDLDYRLSPELWHGGYLFFAEADAFWSLETSFCTS